jgi:predicted nucleic acid-binding protein
VTPTGPYLLDTNLISETLKKKPDPRVIRFLDQAASTALYLSVMTLGELRRGAAMKARNDPQGAHIIVEWVDGIELMFRDRVLEVDTAIARIWGDLSAHRTRPVVDTLLAATAIHHNLTLVTRNVKDVAGTAVHVFNPWAVAPTIN